MASRKFYDRLLIVTGIFLVFFVITMIGIPLIAKGCNIDRSSRSGLLILSVCQAVLLFILPALISARAISRRPARFLCLNNPPGWMPVLGVIFAYLIALPALNQIIFWNENIVFPDIISTWGENLRILEDKARESSNLMLDTESWGGMLVNLAVVALVPAFAEELFFRGTLQRAGSSSGAYYTSIWVVALIFSALHFQVFGFIPRLLLGAWFGYLLFWTRSLYVPIIAHFINNGVVVVCSWLTARGSTFDFEKFGVTEYGFPVAAFVSALATVVFLVYFRRLFFQSERQSLTPVADA